MPPNKKYTVEAMSSAIAEVRAGTLSLRAAAKKYGVPSSSLSDRHTGKVQEGAVWGGRTLLPAEHENEMIQHAIKRASMGIGFSKKTFLIFAGKYAVDQGVTFKGGDATEKWWRGLKKRHPEFSLRSPEPTSSGRHQAMTRERLCKYFASLKGVLEDHDLASRPNLIWNMDETGLSLSTKAPKVLAKKGTKAVHSKTSNSRELITIIACGNANGKVIPPHAIIPGKTTRVLKGYDTENSPAGTNLSVTDSGWTKNGVGQLWFTDTFLPNIGPDRPQLLVMDGHESHHHVEFLKLARDNNIILMELPSKTSNWTQPFDRTVFKSLKSAWTASIQEFVSLTGVTVGHAHFFRLFAKAWSSSMTSSNIANGFAATGIYPYSPGAIPNEAYEPSDLYAPSDNTSPPTADNFVNDSTHTIVNMVVEQRSENKAAAVDLPLAIDENGTLMVTAQTPDTVDENNEDAINILIHEYDQSPEASHQPEENNTVAECSAEQALTVVESAMTFEMKRKFIHAHQAGIELHDSLFYTWRMYADKCSGSKVATIIPEKSKVASNSLFDLPVQTKTPAKQVKRVGQYFVISSDAAYTERVKEKEEKEEKKRLLEERKVKRQRAKEEKESKKRLKMEV